MARDYRSLSEQFFEIQSTLDTPTSKLLADCLLTIHMYEDTIGSLKEATNKLQVENLELKERLDALEKTKAEP